MYRSRLQFGMWNGLDLEYWNNYGDILFQGIEISQNNMKDNLRDVQNFCEINGLTLGFHSPIAADDEMPRLTHPRFLEEKKVIQQYIEKELELAESRGADYVLYHFPYPAIFPNTLDKELYKQILKNEDFEHYFSKDYTLDSFEKIVTESLEMLELLAKNYKTKIVLENDFHGDFQAFFIEKLKQIKNIYLAVDTQRLDIYKRLSPSFRPLQYLKDIFSKIYLVHYSNVLYEEGNFISHIPVLPTQKRNSNYGKVEDYLQFLLENNIDAHILLEHNPTLISRQELDEVYSSTYNLLKGGE